jgi:hypothetical protein
MSSSGLSKTPEGLEFAARNRSFALHEFLAGDWNSQCSSGDGPLLAGNIRFGNDEPVYSRYNKKGSR